MNNSGMSQNILDSANKMLNMIEDGRIHMHIMSNSSIERYGEPEHQEMVEYSDFIKTRLCYDLMNLTGMEYHE